MLAPASALAQAGSPATDCLVKLAQPSVAGGAPASGVLRTGTCFGDGQRVDVPFGISASFEAPAGVRYMLGPTTRMFIREGVYDVKRGSFTAAHETVPVAECGKRRRVEAQRQDMKIGLFSCGTGYTVNVDSTGVNVVVTEGEVRASRAVRLEPRSDPAASEGRNTRREEAEPQYLQQTVRLDAGSLPSLDYSFTDEVFLAGETCEDLFRGQLEEDLVTPGADRYVAEGYRNVGDCHLFDDRWPDAMQYFEQALEWDRRSHFDEITLLTGTPFSAQEREELVAFDLAVAEDHRALGEASLAWGGVELYGLAAREAAGGEISDDELGAALELMELAEASFLQALQIDSILAFDVYPGEPAVDEAVAEDFRNLGDVNLDMASILLEIDDQETRALALGFLDEAVQRLEQALKVTDYLTDVSDWYYAEDYALDNYLLGDALQARASVKESLGYDPAGDQAAAAGYFEEGDSIMRQVEAMFGRE